jgi:hypothetical protein
MVIWQPLKTLLQEGRIDCRGGEWELEGDADAIIWNLVGAVAC